MEYRTTSNNNSKNVPVERHTWTKAERDKNDDWYHIREIEQIIAHWTGINPEEILHRYNSENKELESIRPEEIIAYSTDSIKRMVMKWDDHFIYDTDRQI
jgi:ATP-dependent Clp protease ATP-binding subunit ClpA